VVGVDVDAVRFVTRLRKKLGYADVLEVEEGQGQEAWRREARSRRNNPRSRNGLPFFSH
jgi:hypothetical protein